MLCYLDRTFCPYQDCKHWDKCDRAATDEIKEKAEESGLPMCYFGSEPECYEVNNDKEIDKNKNIRTIN